MLAEILCFSVPWCLNFGNFGCQTILWFCDLLLTVLQTWVNFLCKKSGKNQFLARLSRLYHVEPHYGMLWRGLSSSKGLLIWGLSHSMEEKKKDSKTERKNIDKEQKKKLEQRSKEENSKLTGRRKEKCNNRVLLLAWINCFQLEFPSRNVVLKQSAGRRTSVVECKASENVWKRNTPVQDQEKTHLYMLSQIRSETFHCASCFYIFVELFCVTVVVSRSHLANVSICSPL